MSEAKRNILYLVIDGVPETQRPVVPVGDDSVEVFTLTAANAPEALQKIFGADAVSVWGRVD